MFSGSSCEFILLGEPRNFEETKFIKSVLFLNGNFVSLFRLLQVSFNQLTVLILCFCTSTVTLRQFRLIDRVDRALSGAGFHRASRARFARYSRNVFR